MSERNTINVPRVVNPEAIGDPEQTPVVEIPRSQQEQSWRSLDAPSPYPASLERPSRCPDEQRELIDAVERMTSNQRLLALAYLVGYVPAAVREAIAPYAALTPTEER